jgi:hypothetical protein
VHIRPSLVIPLYHDIRKKQRNKLKSLNFYKYPDKDGDMTKHFDRSALPPARQFYEGEGYSIGRANGKGWAMAKGQPPCHKSKSGRSFSVNLSHGGFRCFGCGAKGDRIKFVQLRDGCDFVTACKILGCWRGTTTAEERTGIARREQERRWNRQREAEQEQAERRERMRLRDELHLDVRLYQELAGQLHTLGPVAEAAAPYWAALPVVLDVLRVDEADYCRASGLDNPFYE